MGCGSSACTGGDVLRNPRKPNFWAGYPISRDCAGISRNCPKNLRKNLCSIFGLYCFLIVKNVVKFSVRNFKPTALGEIRESVTKNAPILTRKKKHHREFLGPLSHIPMGKTLHTVCLVLGNYFRSLLQETLQHKFLGGIDYCNLMSCCFPWKS